ncbi:MAG: PAS domain S-box protein [Polyangiaceae bacterium]|nr:PAS domain S-box protein [Polyangiaceae bacterium]
MDKTEPNSDEPRDRDSMQAGFDEIFNSIMAHTADNIMLLDQDGLIRYINETVPDLTVDQVIGTSVYNYVPEDQHGIMLSCFERVANSHKPDSYDNVYFQEDGSALHFESRVGPVLQSGELTGFLVISRNVTERQDAAADRDRFFALSLDLVCVTGQDGFFKRVNPAFERILGFTSAEMLAQPAHKFIHPDDLERSAEAYQLLADGHPLRDFENRYQHKEGGYRRIAWQAIHDHHTRQIYGAGRDVTEHHALEEQLRQSQKMEAIGQLAGGVAHDFNNLTLAVLMNADLAQTSLGADHPVSAQLEQIINAGERAAGLTRQLLAFSRREPLRTAAICINQLIRDFQPFIRRLIPANIELDTSHVTESLVIEANSGQLEQVLVNFCVNARDAMPNGGQIRIQTTKLTRDLSAESENAAKAEFVELTISDNGTGMDSVVAERIFEPFFTTKKVGFGTGLGLATVYGIIDRHGGWVEVDSSLGRGTTFKVYLRTATSAAIASSVSNARVTDGGRETILFAEDEESVRGITTKILEQAGYLVRAAADGEAAVALFKEHADDIQLLLLDIVMPKLSGAEAMISMREIKPEIPVLFCSGYTSSSNSERGIPDDADLLEKPYRPNVLLDRVRRILDDSASLLTHRH